MEIREKFLERFVSKPTLIQKVEKRLERDGLLGINIGLQEGLFLKSLCSQRHIKKVVEIGTQYGCSASWMAMGLREKGVIWTLEKDSTCLVQARITFEDPDFLSLGCSIHLLEGSALENLKNLEKKGPFDLVFIDANKAGYPDYLHWAKENLSPGGIILADNVYLFGSLFENSCPENVSKKMWQAMNDFLEDIFMDQDFRSSILPTEEGMLFSTKKTKRGCA